MDKQKDRQVYRWTNKRLDKQKDGHTEIDRQRDAHTEIDRQKRMTDKGMDTQR